MTSDDDTMDFFRIVNKEFSTEEEVRASIFIALDIVFGDEAKVYRKGVIGGQE